MTTGYKNNNPGNINYAGQDWEGSTGLTIRTADGQKNIVFINMIYGIRALMVLMHTYISTDGIYNIADILRRFSPNQSESERQQRASYIANTYFNGARTEDDILDLSDHTIMGLTKGIIDTEISPDDKLIPNTYYDVALRYYNSGDDAEAARYTNNITGESGGTGGMVLVLILIGGVGWWISRKK
jgi:hypothetical protein